MPAALRVRPEEVDRALRLRADFKLGVERHALPIGRHVVDDFLSALNSDVDRFANRPRHGELNTRKIGANHPHFEHRDDES